MTKNHRIGLLGIGVAVVITGVVAGISAAATTPHASAATDDILIQTTSAVHLPPAGGQTTQVMATTLPANSGGWVLTGTETAVNFTPSDFVRCFIQADGNQIAGSTALVGDPTQSGEGGQGASLVIPITESGSVFAGANPVTITVLCEHDGNAAQPYVDPSASLWAHKSTGLANA